MCMALRALELGRRPHQLVVVALEVLERLPQDFHEGVLAHGRVPKEHGAPEKPTLKRDENDQETS